MSNQFRLLLFIVVISGALCTVEDYVIMSQCAHNKAIHVAAEGTVSVTDISQTQNITIVGLPDYVNNNLKIALYAKETQRYLCFNDQWKLVGMKELRDTCYFNETIVHGYFVFRSVVDLQRRVGFTHRGKAVGPKKNVNDACYLFTKIQADQFFHQHTDYFAPKSKSTKIISGISNAPQTTTATHTTLGALARSASQRAALSAAATTATVTATATQRNHNSNNRLLRTNNKNKRVNGVRKSNSSNNNRNSNNNQNEEYTNGHSSNLSSSSNHNNNNSNQSSNINHSNSSNLVSNSQQQVDLSQQRQHNNNSNGRTREHVRQQQQHQQQQHQVRHHHNDPNLVARRQHHEHKQKRRQHQRLRSGKITSPATTTVAHERATATTTTRATYSTTATGVVAHSKQQHEKDARHEPQAATVANVAAKAATATSIIMKSTTTIANNRKGRRRKGRKQRKQQQTQRAQQQMLPLVAREPAKAAHSPTPTTWLWSDSPTPPLYSLSTQMLADVPSSLSPATTFGDYSGEWMTSVPINVDATSIDTAAPSSQTPTLSTLVASDTPTPIYLVSTTDLSDGASPLMSTNDYNNNTDFTSVVPADEESSLNATFITEIDESRMWPEPTIALDEQLNSITSEQQQQQFTTQNVATPVSTAESIAPTSTTWSESSEQYWSSSTTTNETDDLETVFPSPTAIVDTESVAATAIFSEDGNVTEETQTAAEATDSYATSNSTSSEIEAESSSSTYNDVGNTEALTEVGDTQSTTTAQQKVYSLPAERGHIGHMWRKQSGIAASIATLLRQQLLATSASSGNVYAWRPQRGEEYSDEIIVATGRPVDAELETTTDVASGDRATWWQHHMNHSGTNFWDKGIADEVPSGGDDADLDWLKQLTKQRTASKRRHNNRKPNNNSSRDVEAVSQQPLQALSTSDSSLGFGKKYVPEGKSQRQSSKAHSGNNKSPAATTTAHEYSSTMATSRTSSATTHSAGVITPATTTARMKDNTLATTTPTQHLYPLQQLLGNKTVLPLHNPRPLAHFDGNSNHLAHTHTPTASTFSTTTSATAPTSTTVAGDATTAIAALTTKKSIRISTQKLLATPFHQLTYVRNNAGDIDIDNMDNISVYPDLLEESGELAEQRSTERAETDATRNSRLTIVSGYLPTSATATLPESIRLAKVKINKERKRMMSLRKRHSRRHA